MRRAALAVLALLALSGCEMAAYYAQAVGGHLDLIARAQPVARLLGDPATPAPLKARLEAATRMRDFAVRALQLPDNGSYRSYAELGRPYAVWNVVAAPVFSLEPVQSCFPVAGCVSYRGFYARADAEAHAARLRAAGNDVYIGGVPAYSTLGWFDDPLLSTFIRYPEAELARLLFHELAHQRVYVKGDSTFNESFAVAVEREGVRRWLRAEGRDADLQQLGRAEERRGALLRLIAGTRERLKSLYREGLPEDQMRERKAQAFRDLAHAYEEHKRERWGGFAGYDRYFAADGLNNAMLASFATYTDHVPAFERLLAEARGDLAAFYARVSALAAMDKPAREAQLRQQ